MFAQWETTQKWSHVFDNIRWGVPLLNVGIVGQSGMSAVLRPKSASGRPVATQVAIVIYLEEPMASGLSHGACSEIG